MNPRQSAIVSIICFAIVPLLSPFSELVTSDKPISPRVLIAVTLVALINLANTIRALHSDAGKAVLTPP